MSELLEKAVVLSALVARMRAALTTLETSQRAAQAGATHDEARPEHSKDTRAIEGQYLARGLADRAEALRETVAALESLRVTPELHEEVSVLSLVSLRDREGEASCYFMSPAGGGEKLVFGSVVVQTLTPSSPLGRRLVGREVGDEIRLRVRGEARVVAVESVR